MYDFVKGSHNVPQSIANTNTGYWHTCNDIHWRTQSALQFLRLWVQPKLSSRCQFQTFKPQTHPLCFTTTSFSATGAVQQVPALTTQQRAFCMSSSSFSLPATLDTSISKSSPICWQHQFDWLPPCQLQQMSNCQFHSRVTLMGNMFCLQMHSCQFLFPLLDTLLIGSRWCQNTIWRYCW